MARIKDLISAIVSTGDGFEDIVRIITAAGHSAVVVHNETLTATLNWGSSEHDHPAMKAMAAQGVAYKKINLKSVMPMRPADAAAGAIQSNTAERVRRFLRELQVRDELYYPFAIIASSSLLLISVVDFDIVMAIAREQQMQDDRQTAHIPPVHTVPLSKPE